MSIDKIRRIIKAKLSNKENMPDWYYERLEKCIGCEFNSGNKDKLSFTERMKVTVNLGKDTCLECGCSIVDKASDKQEQCPLEEPKWLKLEDIVQEEKFKVENKSKDKVTLGKKENYYELSYGIIKKNSDSKINVEITADNLKNPKVKASCGCTTPGVEQEGNVYKISISYDTKRIGDFRKEVRFTFEQDNIRKQITLIITGKVEN